MLLRRLALWALAAAPASLVTCFVIPPSVRCPLGAVFEGDRLVYVRARTQRVATSAASGAVLVAAAKQPGIPSDDREDAHAATTRTGFVRAGGKVVVAASTAVTTAAAAAALVTVPPAFAAEREPEITSKCFIEVRIMEPLNEANGYSSKNAYKGKLVFGLYGKACPKAAENFLRYAAADRTNGEPSYSAGQLTKMEQGVLLEGGRIKGLNSISIGGQEQLEYGGEVISIPPLMENASVELKHDRKGLLTRDRLSRGPDFGVTLGAAPDLDGSHQVFGRLLQGEDVLARLENVPVYGGSTRLAEGTLASDAFKAQNRALVYIGKNVFKDERAVDRTGLLMRRVDILSCGRL